MLWKSYSGWRLLARAALWQRKHKSKRCPTCMSEMFSNAVFLEYILFAAIFMHTAEILRSRKHLTCVCTLFEYDG